MRNLLLKTTSLIPPFSSFILYRQSSAYICSSALIHSSRSNHLVANPGTNNLKCNQLSRLFSQLNDANTPQRNSHKFGRGDKIQVEVGGFGHLGATVYVIGLGHSNDDLIDEEDPPLAQGIIYQQEIRYFRESRNNVDVVSGEVLKGFVDRAREDGKLDVSLRPVGHDKALLLAEQILERLECSPNGSISVGDKSHPKDISLEFPGASKAAFKKAVANLYKNGKVTPGPQSITLNASKK